MLIVTMVMVIFEVLAKKMAMVTVMATVMVIEFKAIC